MEKAKKTSTKATPKKIYVNSHSFSCDGGGGALGHPNVYLKFANQQTTLDCPYCGRHFEHKAQITSIVDGVREIHGGH